MSKYEILLFIHLFGVFLILAGAGVGTATGIAMTRTSVVRSIGLLAKTGRAAELFSTVPGALIAIVFGSWLVAYLGAYEFSQPWVSASYLLWFIAVGLGTGLMSPALERIAARADELEAEGVDTSDELLAMARDPKLPLIGNLLHLITLALLALMIFRPGA